MVLQDATQPIRLPLIARDGTGHVVDPLELLYLERRHILARLLAVLAMKVSQGRPYVSQILLAAFGLAGDICAKHAPRD
jgi:hypothetical protein